MFFRIRFNTFIFLLYSIRLMLDTNFQIHQAQAKHQNLQLHVALLSNQS